jgi:hypothetical protein
VVCAALVACKRPAPPAPASPAPPPDAAPAVAAAPPQRPAPDAAHAVAADYDPTALVAKGAEPISVYMNEPRTPAWADAVEEVIGGQIRRDLQRMVPEAKGLGVSCRTLSCVIAVDAPREKIEQAIDVVTLVTLGPITVNAGLSPKGTAQILFLTERRFADPAKFIDWYRKVHKKTLEEIRSGKRPNPLPVPVDQVPVE